jgi:hypothetical protein
VALECLYYVKVKFKILIGFMIVVLLGWHAEAQNFVPFSTNALVVGGGTQVIATADVNGDSKVDLIEANGGLNTLTILTNKGDGTFKASSTNGVGSEPVFVVAADVNGDGKVDLISANYGTDTLTVLTNI